MFLYPLRSIVMCPTTEADLGDGTYLNPVLAGPEGCVAVDARVRLRRVERATSTKTW